MYLDRVQRAKGEQEKKVLLHHRVIYDKISKFFPFQMYYYIYPEIEYQNDNSEEIM